MNTFRKNSLYLAVAGASALGAGTAQAVALNPDGLGNVLLYPYYTVRETSAGNPYISLLTVVNSTASAKAVKVRFLEGKNSREVLDFNLYLSAKDVWVAEVASTADGAGISTQDTSCTNGVVSNDSNNPTRFVNYAYVGAFDDPANDDLDRTREGYVEIIEMGTMWGYGARMVTHKNGVPYNCDAIRSLDTSLQTDTYVTKLSGGLFGSMALINVSQGVDFGVDAVALADFNQIVSDLYFPPGDINPNLNQANAISLVVDYGNGGGNAFAYVTDWDFPWLKPIDAVSAVLMHDNIYNEFVLDKGTASGTDWVITMPTKGVPDAYYNSKYGTMGSPGDKELKVTKLFQRNFKDTGACDDISLAKYDREEKLDKVTSSFSPPPPGVKDSLCWEANVLTFRGSNVLGSKIAFNIANPTFTFENGWAELSFPTASTTATYQYHLLGGAETTRIALASGLTSTYASATYYGLPVIGFAAITFHNGNIGGVQSSFGGNFNHKYTRRVEPLLP
ncbi:MAG: hypothetical protein U1F51_01890 [Burkholderiales bacterium]